MWAPQVAEFGAVRRDAPRYRGRAQRSARRMMSEHLARSDWQIAPGLRLMYTSYPVFPTEGCGIDTRSSSLSV